MRLTNPLWYLAAFLIALGGTMVGTVVAAGAWDGVRQARVMPLTGPVDAGGQSLAVFTDQLQPNREIVCTEAVADATPRTIRDATLDIAVDMDGTRWHLLAVDTDGRDGTTVACAPKDGRGDTAAYGYAVVDGFDVAVTAQRITVIAVLAGIALAIAVFVARRRARTE